MRRQQQWTVQQSARTRQRKGRYTREHRRLRNGRDGGGRRDVSAYIGIQTGSFPLRGPAVRSGPFPVYLSALTELLRCRPRNPLITPPLRYQAKTVTSALTSWFHAQPDLAERDRHGCGVPTAVTFDQAQAVVHLAVTVVQWGRVGVLKKR